MNDSVVKLYVVCDNKTSFLLPLEWKQSYVRDSSSSELVLLPLAIPLGLDPALPILHRSAEQHILILIVQLRLAHLLHGGHPELVIKQKLDALLLVCDLAESVGRQLSVSFLIQDFSCSTEGHWRALLLENLRNLRPACRFRVAFDHVGEVELFVEPQRAEELLRLLVHLVLVLADKELHKVTKGRVDEFLFPVGLLVVLNLLLADLFDLLHILLQELILVRFRQALRGLLKECLAHPIVLFLISPGNVALNLSKVLSKRFKAEYLLLTVP